MRLLLDTHVLLWAAGKPGRLSPDARRVMKDAGNELMFSAASLLEIVIKRRLGRDDFQVDPRLFRRGLLVNGYSELPIGSEHAVAIEGQTGEHREDAERFLREFRDRLANFALELHPEKTRLIEFGRFAHVNRQQRGERKPETFTFLGFTHYCARTSKGHFVIHRRTAPKRMRATLHAIKVRLRQRLHEPVNAVGAWLKRVVSGYYRYHAVPENQRALRRFRDRLCDLWRSMLGRRSQRSRPSWKRIRPTFERWIPRPCVLHPYPDARFAATHPR